MTEQEMNDTLPEQVTDNDPALADDAEPSEAAPSEDAAADAAPEPTDVEEDTPKEASSEPFFTLTSLFEYIEIFVFSVAAVLIVFTLAFRLCRVDGSSMRNTLHDSEMLITTSFGTPEPGDIIVFHMTSETYDHFNEPLVKRVIAVGGQTVRYDYTTKALYVDGVQVNDEWAHYLDSQGRDIGILTQMPMYGYDPLTQVFETTVPEGKLFVMGDNRNHSSDSRTVQVGFVDERQVLGKVLANLGEMRCGRAAGQ